MSKMKAAVFVEPGRIVLDSKPIPDVGSLDALMRVTTTTICGTDVHILKGEYPVRKGLPIGHEPDASVRVASQGLRPFLPVCGIMRRNLPTREPRNRVVQVRRFGGPEELGVVDAPLPTAGRGEARVRVLASSVEYTDVLIRRHLYPQTMHRRPPFVIGYDVVGEIDQLGDGVSGLQVGDRVADMTVVGSNAAYRTLRADRLTRVPAASTQRKRPR